MSSTISSWPKNRQRSASFTSKAQSETPRRSHRNTLTCTNCRIRKTKCDGTQPGCKTCEVYQDECRYEKPPPMSQIIAMSKRLQEYEQIIEALKEKVLLSANAEEKLDARKELANHRQGSDSSSDHGLDADPGSPGTTHNPEPEDFVKVPASLLSDLSLDENGKLCYYGPTSAVHDPPILEGQSAANNRLSSLMSDPDVRMILTSNAVESRAWEDFALGNAALNSDIPKDVISKLLQLHWSWIAPLFMWVYRPAFMRDMITGGQYYSQFLLLVLCAHSSRFHGGSVGEVLISRARLLLGNEIQKPSSIPTVQALLQLSARDLAFGSISQAWLYSGMAFRMVSDLGLHHSSGKIVYLGHLSAEDLEIRRRLFWSCYFWDKAISLYLGRMPALTELPCDSDPVLFDDSTAQELWAPYYGDSGSTVTVSTETYPAVKSHMVSCFANSCKLAVIINQIITQLYSRRALSVTNCALRRVRDQLDDWRANSPQYLRYDPDNLPEICGPPHILAQNLLYYTTAILLHRPFYSSPVHLDACHHASESIEKLLLLFEKTFGFTRITYLMAYCIYTGASAIIQDVQAGDLDATKKMSTFLRALKGGCTTCPVVQRSIDIIKNSLQNLAVNSQAQTDNAIAASHRMSYLPAFPHHNWQVDPMNDGNLGIMDSDTFLLLDCFPENHIDTGSSEWYMPS
ncbi:fungal-specific transcription factor domain-containing protein [Lipomyces orientalis]|uniref:Fungal-specific transcription factor domain-containing protein n=1 Tax=Lipomyces orientalis TaxID=1233043 RepID=A0ACC3TCQ0_9ASCO